MRRESDRGAEGSYRSLCEVKSERDRYGRLLGTCYSMGGANLNEWVVLRGWALAYRRYSRRYAIEESEARAAGRGMHAGEYIPPWDWRQGRRLD